jgi:hypothetical protein
MRTLRNQDFASNQICGSSLKGYTKATYKQLVAVLGEPTFSDASADDKTQVEWVVKFKNNYYTAYDWKTYDREYTMNELQIFHIGGKTDALEFINALENKIKTL